MILEENHQNHGFFFILFFFWLMMSTLHITLSRGWGGRVMCRWQCPRTLPPPPLLFQRKPFKRKRKGGNENRPSWNGPPKAEPLDHPPSSQNDRLIDSWRHSWAKWTWWATAEAFEKQNGSKKKIEKKKEKAQQQCWGGGAWEGEGQRLANHLQDKKK